MSMREAEMNTTAIDEYKSDLLDDLLDNSTFDNYVSGSGEPQSTYFIDALGDSLRGVDGRFPDNEDTAASIASNHSSPQLCLSPLPTSTRIKDIVNSSVVRSLARTVPSPLLSRFHEQERLGISIQLTPPVANENQNPTFEDRLPIGAHDEKSSWVHESNTSAAKEKDNANLHDGDMQNQHQVQSQKIDTRIGLRLDMRNEAREVTVPLVPAGTANFHQAVVNLAAHSKYPNATPLRSSDNNPNSMPPSGHLTSSSTHTTINSPQTHPPAPRNNCDSNGIADSDQRDDIEMVAACWNTDSRRHSVISSEYSLPSTSTAINSLYHGTNNHMHMVGPVSHVIPSTNNLLLMPSSVKPVQSMPFSLSPQMDVKMVSIVPAISTHGSNRNMFHAPIDAPFYQRTEEGSAKRRKKGASTFPSSNSANGKCPPKSEFPEMLHAEIVNGAVTFAPDEVPKARGKRAIGMSFEEDIRREIAANRKNGVCWKCRLDKHKVGEVWELGIGES